MLRFSSLMEIARKDMEDSKEIGFLLGASEMRKLEMRCD